jgi:hypothetical protein
MNAARRQHGVLTGKLGHCEIQIRPQGVKTGHYQAPKKEHIANLEQIGYIVPSVADSAMIAARLSR